jgi:hypothetical protein
MSTAGIIAIIVIVAIIVIAIAAFVAWRKRRSTQLQEQFGPEYDRTVEDAGDKREAENILIERRKRVHDLNIVPLSTADRDRYVQQWQAVQAEFVDDPSAAISHADELIGKVMKARNYPVGEFDQRADDISVDHPQLVQDYRAAHDVAQQNDAGNASTEDLRQAMVHYRALFQDLLETPEPAEVQQ